MKSLIAAAAMLALAAPASAAEFRVKLDGAAHPLLHGRGGLHAADSRTERSLVRVISPGSPISRRGTVRVLVMNLGGSPFDFGPRQIRLELADGTVLSEVPVAEFGKGAALIEREMNRAAVTDRRVRSSLTSSSGGGTGSASTPLSGYSGGGDAGGADSAAAMRQDRNQDADGLPGAETLDAIGGVLQATRVGPQEASGGYLVFELPKALRSQKADQPLTIVVTAGRDEHRFLASLDRN
jgi:hypothetical protein